MPLLTAEQEAEVAWLNEQQSDYRFDEWIGSGQFGTVFRGTHLATEKRKALKVVATTEKSQREVELMSSLPKHPNLVQLETSFEIEDYTVMVMELCELDLKTLIERAGRLPEPVVRELARGIAKGIAALRDIDVFHRDVKPENVFVSIENGRPVPKLGDFGLAVNTEKTRMFFKAAGSPFYMAPELWLAEMGYDRQADMYSLGCTVYEMMCGKPPFSFCTSKSQLRRYVRFGDVCEPAVNEILSISPEAVSFLTKLLVKQPQMRLSIDEVFDQPWLLIEEEDEGSEGEEEGVKDLDLRTSLERGVIEV
jgi:serine/threonine protein kinase